MYQNIDEIIEDLKKYHTYGVSGVCSISNFFIYCKNIEKAIKLENKKEAVEDMTHMTHLYKYATKIRYSKEILLVADISLEAVKCDFDIAKSDIEKYFCENFVTGDFEITQEVLNKHWDMVDWDAYHNKNSRRFINAIKKANKVVNYNKDDEISAKYYGEQSEKERWNFEEIFYSTYNGGRVIASFKNLDDAIKWAYPSDLSLDKESDGLYWAEQPAY